MPLHDDEKAAGLARLGQDLLEIADRRIFGRLAVDGHQSVAGAKGRTLGGTVFHHRLDRQAGIQLDNLDAEVAAAGEHLPDDALAFRRRSGALLLVVRMDDNGERHDGGDNWESSQVHLLRRTSLAGHKCMPNGGQCE